METGCHGWWARIGLAAVSLLVAAGSARADERVSRPAPKRAYVVVFGSVGVEESRRRAAEDAVATGVRGNGAVAVVVPQRPVDDAAVGALGEADVALEAARTKVQEFDLDGAIELLAKSSTIYARWLPDLVRRDGGTQKLLEAYRLAAVASFLNADEDSAARALAYCFVLKPQLEYNAKDFPPQMAEFVISARLLVEELGRGIADVRVPGSDEAVIYISGVEQGGAPIEVQDLPPGPNVINLVVNGVTVGVDTVDVDAGEPTSVVMQVPAVVAAIPEDIEALRTDVGRSKASTRMLEAGKSLGVESMVFVVATGEGFEGYVYDLRTGRLAGTGTGADAHQLGAALVGGADWGTLKPLQVSAGSRETPIWDPDHRYFWHAVGAAAGVVTVVTVGVIAVKSRGLSPGEKHVVFGLGTAF